MVHQKILNYLSSFTLQDERIKSEKLDYYIDGGCTALVALFTLGKLFVANAGDCRYGIHFLLASFQKCRVFKTLCCVTKFQEDLLDKASFS